MGVWFNEFHYDDTGRDSGERIELAGRAGTDLTGWSIVLYDGATGLAYKTVELSGTIANELGGFGATVAFRGNGDEIVNGQGGFALVNDSGRVVDFVSYGGSFIAKDGPAAGETSTDVGVTESGDGAKDQSIQRVGVDGDRFEWASSEESFGSINLWAALAAFEQNDDGPPELVFRGDTVVNGSNEAPPFSEEDFLAYAQEQLGSSPGRGADTRGFGDLLFDI